METNTTYTPAIRAEYERTDVAEAKLDDVQRKLSMSEMLWNSSAFRKGLILVGLALA